MSEAGGVQDVRILAPRRTPLASEPLAVDEGTQQYFRGATVRALQVLPPASAEPDTDVKQALAAARAHAGQPVLVVKDARVVGYAAMVDLVALVAQDAEGEHRVSEVQQPFAGTAEAPSVPKTYRVVTAETPLAELAVFLRSAPLALVTDAEREQVLGVATGEDLARYSERMGLDTGARRPLPWRTQEEAQKDHALAQFLRMLDGYSPLIPDEVSDFYLERSGFQCQDARLKRLLSLAAEKFVADIAADAFQYARIRSNAGPGRARPAGGQGSSRVRMRLLYMAY